jgi:hypothetical protein
MLGSGEDNDETSSSFTTGNEVVILISVTFTC